MEIKKKVVSGLAATLSAAMLLATAACGGGSDSAADDGSFMTVDVFSSTANYQGVQKGWFAKIVKDKFNMELNIIAPNVAGGGDTLFDTRSTAGNLGDLVIVGMGNGRLQKLVKSKLITDMTPYYDKMTNVKNYQAGVDYVTKQAGQDGVWGVPGNVSDESPTKSSEGVEPAAAPYIRWDYYAKVGYPKISNLDDFANVLKQMQDKAREETGQDDIYAVSLFKDWDGELMQNAQAASQWYGWYAQNSVLVPSDDDAAQVTPASQVGSGYDQMIEFLNKCNDMGLVDPESTTQNWDNLSTKVTEGKVLMSIWSWLGKPRMNSTENQEKGIGFMLAPLENMKVYTPGFQPEGDGNSFIAIGSKAKNKERLAKFIDWLYSPEGIYASAFNSGGAACPKDMCWTLNDKGEPELNEFGEKAMFDSAGLQVPAEYGGGSYNDGVSALNFKAVNANGTDPETKAAYNPQLWATQLAKTTKLQEDWAKHMDGAKTDLEYLEKTDRLAVAPGATYTPPEEDSQISTLRSSVKTEVINASWQAVMAGSQDECQKIFKDMGTQINDLGYAQVLEVDKKNADDLIKARQEIVKQFADKEDK
ncbi:ABC transporter substrate-binding protein [Bifidobacterium cuniculi]|uniref:Extracellular solute-binding protein n=1 Tax=Bifidobacterium cuniculi TaxID=1688 RepID=A0A087AZN3_9BIFI|nr:extracellular solute-binding protein [Bifidobacterium cuniculi]KFI64233.1 extracellular solute-binding protein [Bifidobacterium cuniculi]